MEAVLKQSDCLRNPDYICHLTAILGVCSNRHRVSENKRLSKHRTGDWGLTRGSFRTDAAPELFSILAKTNVNRWQ